LIVVSLGTKALRLNSLLDSNNHQRETKEKKADRGDSYLKE